MAAPAHVEVFPRADGEDPTCGMQPGGYRGSPEVTAARYWEGVRTEWQRRRTVSADISSIVVFGRQREIDTPFFKERNKPCN